VFGLDDDSDADQDDESDTIPLADLPRPTAPAKRASPQHSTRCRVDAAAAAEIVVRMAEAGGRPSNGSSRCPSRRRRHDRGEAAVHGKALGDSDTASFDVVMVAPDGKAMAKTGFTGSSCASIPNISGIATRAIGSTSRSM
jgi:hypothetical protein